MPEEVGLKRKERRKKMFGFGIFPTLIVGAIAIFWGIVIVKAIPGIIKAFKGEMKIKYDQHSIDHFNHTSMFDKNWKSNPAYNLRSGNHFNSSFSSFDDH